MQNMTKIVHNALQAETGISIVTKNLNLFDLS